MSNAHDQYYDEDRHRWPNHGEHRLDEITDRVLRHHLITLINSVASASTADSNDISRELAIVRDRVSWLNRRRGRINGAA